MFKPEGFSLEIFKKRYSFTENETWEEACRRVSKQVSIAELPDKVNKYEEKFYEELINNRFVPGGRIWYNSGRPNPQLLNCFVLGSELDSREGWGNIAKEMIITSMSGGGCGVDFSDVRPKGATIAGQKGSAPGAVELMKLLNGCADPIRAGGQRRTALLFSLNLHHPDILDFLDSKFNDKALQNANISVKCKNVKDFIKAVKKDGDWELHWKGKYKKSCKARILWDKIVKNAYMTAEPGFLNWELVENENTISYVKTMTCTNPCGEIVLPEYGSCDLGHLVLTRFIKDGEVDWHEMGNTIRIAVRFLDNVLSVNKYPLEEMKIEAEKFRRIGLGTTALADMLAILGYRYGSPEANKFVDKLFRFISKQAYESSVMLAIEKGAFPECNFMEHVQTGYVKRMTKKIKSLIEDHGIRNCALLTQAPTGTVSILSGNCSSGIEPMFAPAYERRWLDGDKKQKELVFHPLCEQFIKEGKDVSHFVGANDLSVRDHMEIQKVIQNHIDNSISKTINIPKTYDIKEMSEIWLEYLPHLKGATFYRDGSRDAPLKPVKLEDAIKRKKIEKVKVEAAHVDDCPGGKCEIKKLDNKE